MKSKHVASTLLALGIICTSAWAQPREADQRILYEAQRDVPCLTDVERQLIRSRLDAQRENLRALGVLPMPDASAIVLFQWPLNTPPGFSDFGYHGISNFVDQDPAFPDELLDYNCGDRTYDLDSGYNHQGIDYFNWPFSWLKMDNDQVVIVSVADGIICDKFDGNFDRSCAFGGSWNAVYVEHADGSIAWYGHMKEGSTTYKAIGESVSAGEYLGVVGSSGSSTGPHLHLEVYDGDGNLVEPYAGPCNMMNSESWWASQRPYYDSAINALLTHDATPQTPACPQQEIPNARDAFLQGENVTWGAFYRDQLDTQTTDYSVRKPDDSVQWSWSHNSDADHYAASGWTWSNTLPGDAPLGTWTFRAEYDGNVYDHAFSVCDDPGGPPTIDCPLNATVECGMAGGTSAQDPGIVAFLYGATGSGSCDLTPTITNDGPDFFPLGGTVVTFTATDDFGSQSFCSATLTVEDTTPPDISCPGDVTVECSQHGGTPDSDPVIAAFLAGASATDICDVSPSISHDGPALFPLGETVVTFTATDDSGNQNTCTASVFVEDTTPPTISVDLSQYILWPPNHRMRDIEAFVEVDDVCDADPQFVLTSIVSDEPDNGTGDGDFPDDIQDADFGTADTEFALRAERMGGGDGRVYTIVYTVSDMSGNMSDDTVEVVVPHNRSGAAAAGSGFLSDLGGLDLGYEEFSLVIPGGHGLGVENIDGGRAHLMNDIGVLLPTSHQLEDVTGDGEPDLEIFFDVEATVRILDDPGATLPVGLLYRHGDGHTYQVSDIFALGSVVGVDPVSEPTVRLMSPSPNPFHASTRIAYDVPAGSAAIVNLSVYDVGGRKVRELVNTRQAPGVYSIVWDRRSDAGQTVAAGVYYLRRSVVGMEPKVARLIVLD